MAPTPEIQNYLWWLKQRGQAFPVSRPRVLESAAPRHVRFLVVLEQDVATLPESQRILVERMLAATTFPREDFVFHPAVDAATVIAESEVEAVICLGSRALAAISSVSFKTGLDEVLAFSPARATLLCSIHAPEDMERDPQLKRQTWQQLQRLMAAVKKEP